jgi:uncharacterized membrane protein YgaE (UPF0421/DUF939 family)
MKKETSYRITLAVVLSIALAVFLWYYREFSALQIGCASIILLAGMVHLVSNPANNTIRVAAGIPLLAAGTTLLWTTSRHPSLKGLIIYVVLAITVAPLMFLRKPVSSNQDTHN